KKPTYASWGRMQCTIWLISSGGIAQCGAPRRCNAHAYPEGIDSASQSAKRPASTLHRIAWRRSPARHACGDQDAPVRNAVVAREVKLRLGELDFGIARLHRRKPGLGLAAQMAEMRMVGKRPLPGMSGHVDRMPLKRHTK